ncbi:kinase-like domain-containing protein [Irpex lacteus]|nr:kinase-like domain-containing protein [Irpex lacteus]
MLGVLRWLPSRFKLWIYLSLSRPLSYEQGGTGKVYFFRFGIPLVLKRSDRTVSTEADALCFLNRVVPHLPIPKLIDCFCLDGVTYTVMTRLPGRDLAQLENEESLSSEAMELIASDVANIVEDLWSVPQPTNLHGQVMVSASGHGLPHPVSFHRDLGGPYPSTIDCYKTMVMDMSALPPGHFKPIIEDPISWVHWDLTMRNVLVHNGRVSGIIDWEDSGWLPRHWLIHSLRSPRPGCQGAWARYWHFTYRFQPETEEAYAASRVDGVLTYPLCS